MGLFDPSKARGARKAEGPAAPAVRDGAVPVSRLAEIIALTLRDGIASPIRVVGEVSGFRDRTHWYFDLKDEGAVVSCACFAQAARKQGFTPENGQEVVATGRVDFYAKQGKTQLYVDKLEPVGAGALELRFRALCEELRGLGWFEVGRKRALPAFPRRVAVVTSRSGAALQDVIDTARRRCPAVELVVCDVPVQGDGAAPAIVRTLGELSARHGELGIDAVVVTRGGGSMEDLWAFNERAVAQAVLDCPVPIARVLRRCADPRRLERARESLERAGGLLIDVRGERLSALERELIIAGPASVLARGYSVTTRADGSVVRSGDEVGPGDVVRTRVRDGEFSSVVEGGGGGRDRPVPERTPEAPPPRRASRRKRRRKGGADPDQLGLF